jgi:hypothetical protein
MAGYRRCDAHLQDLTEVSFKDDLEGGRRLPVLLFAPPDIASVLIGLLATGISPASCAGGPKPAAA